jgi:hypothetical protein
MVFGHQLVTSLVSSFGFFISPKSSTWPIALAGSRGPHEMHDGIHVVGVAGRMKVEDGGQRGVTQPFWLRIVVQQGFPFGVSWRSIPQETTDAKQSATASTRAAQRAA